MLTSDPHFPDEQRFPERREFRLNHGLFVVRFGMHNEDAHKVGFRGLGEDFPTGARLETVRVIRPDASIVECKPIVGWRNWTDDQFINWLADVEVRDPMNLG